VALARLQPRRVQLEYQPVGGQTADPPRLKPASTNGHLFGISCDDLGGAPFRVTLQWSTRDGVPIPCLENGLDRREPGDDVIEAALQRLG
jgi:hypothetical protein